MIKIPCLAVSFVLLILSGVAHAQSKQVSLDASARAFFKQGLKFADEGDVRQAADRFRRALSIRYSPVIAYNLASMLEAQGELLESTELLYGVESGAEPESELVAAARRLRLQVEPKLAQLTIEIDSNVSNPHAFLDDIELIPVQLGVPIPVDPRMHKLRLMRGAVLIVEESVELRPGASHEILLKRRVTVPSPDEIAAQALATQRARDRQRAATEGGILHSPWLWAGVGAVVVGAAVIVAVVTLSGGGSTTASAQ